MLGRSRIFLEREGKATRVKSVRKKGRTTLFIVVVKTPTVSSSKNERSHYLDRLIATIKNEMLTSRKEYEALIWFLNFSAKIKFSKSHKPTS